MPTDTERREVARRLRELRMTAPGATSVGHGYLRSLFWAVYGDGLRGSTRWNWFERMCSRLADLIEPGGHECVPGECPLNVREMRHSTKEEQAKYGAMLEKMSIGLHPVDRDALLSLADEIETYRLPISGIAVAEHIRKALGVDDAEA